MLEKKSNVCFEECEDSKKHCQKNTCRYYIPSENHHNCVMIASKNTDGLTLREIGEIYNITRMRVCQIQKKAIKKLAEITELL